MLRLLPEKAHGDEEGEVGVLVAGLLEHAVQNLLDVLPDGVPVGADHDGAPHGPVVGELGLLDDLEVPLAEVLALGG